MILCWQGPILSKCTGLKPQFAWGHFNLACIFDRSGKKTEAIAEYTALLKHTPDFLPAYVNRGVAHLELKRHAEAFDDFSRAQALGRADATVLAGQAMSLEGLERHAEADAAFAAAFAKESQFTSAARRRLRLQVYGFAVSARLPQQARAAFEEILRDDPKHVQALYGVGMLELQDGSTEQALGYFAKALETDPGFVAARRQRALLLARSGILDTATREINACLEREPRSGETLYAAACVAAIAAQRMGTGAETRDLIEKSLDLLHQAAENGKPLNAASDDPDLKSLRRHPRFRKLLPDREPVRNRDATA